MIPQETTPLTKFIRTLEGWIVVVVNVVLIATPIITNSLSAGTAVKYGAIFNGITVASRSLLKGVASFSPMFGAPIQPKGIGAASANGGDTPAPTQPPTPSADGTGEQDVSGVAPPMDFVGEGTPAEHVQYAGAPDEVAPHGANVVSPPSQPAASSSPAESSASAYGGEVQ